MAESKVQKVARQGAAQQTTAQCACGGPMVWAKLATNRSRMVLVCQRCGAIGADKGA